MTLKANRPWIELAVVGGILFLSIKIFLLIFEKQDPTIIIPTGFFLVIGLIATAWTNKEYRTYDLDSRLSFQGQFWGQSTIELTDLTGFKIKERKNTTNPIPFNEYDIVIFTRQNKDLTIRQDNYNSDDIKKFKEQLETMGVPFLGTEKFSWTKSLKDLLKLKLFE